MIFTSISLSFRDIPRNYIESFSISVSGSKSLQSKTPMAQEKIGIILFYFILVHHIDFIMLYFYMYNSG